MLIVFGLICYFLLGLWLLLLHRISGCFRSWNTFTLLSLLLIAHHGIGLPFSFGFEEVAQIPATEANWLMWLSALAVMYALILLGAWLANCSFKFSAKEVPEVSPPVSQLPDGVNVLFWVLLAIGCFLVVVHLISVDLPFSPIDFLMRAIEPLEYEQMRTASGVAGVESILGYASSLIGYAVLPASSFFLLYAAATKRKYAVLFAAVVGILLTIAVMSGKKSLMIVFFMGLYVAIRIGWYSGRLRLLSVTNILFLSGLILTSAYLYTAQYRGMYFLEGLESTWYRIALEPNRALQLYLWAYPGVLPHTNGTSTNVISMLMGVPARSPQLEIPQGIFGQQGTGWNVVFIGDAWADFGWLGVIGASLVVGILCQSYNIYCARLRPTAWSRAVQASLVLFSSKLAQVSLPTALVTFGMGGIFVFYLITRKSVGRDRPPEAPANVSKDELGVTANQKPQPGAGIHLP